jgi:hypothetical protein
MKLDGILHENQSLVQSIWRSRLGKKGGKETLSEQKPKRQLPGAEERHAEKNIRENGTVGEPGYAERSWVVRRRGRGFWKGDRAAPESGRRQAWLRQVQAGGGTKCRPGMGVAAAADWDRASIHLGKITKAHLQEHPEILIEELPAYAPQLNPEGIVMETSSSISKMLILQVKKKFAPCSIAAWLACVFDQIYSSVSFTPRVFLLGNFS